MFDMTDSDFLMDLITWRHVSLLTVLVISQKSAGVSCMCDIENNDNRPTRLFVQPTMMQSDNDHENCAYFSLSVGW